MAYEVPDRAGTEEGMRWQSVSRHRSCCLDQSLRNPSAPIRQAVAVIRAPSATESQVRWSVDVIERQVHNMARLLDDLLDVSRINCGTSQVRKGLVRLRSVLDAGSMFSWWRLPSRPAPSRRSSASGAGSWQSAYERGEVHRSAWANHGGGVPGGRGDRHPRQRYRRRHRCGDASEDI